MPNLLAHFGAQGLATRVALPRADLRWVLLGAVLPDVAWILHRIAEILPLGLDPIDLRLYAIVQASLAFSLLLAVGLSLLAERPGRVLAILALGSVLHLVLDASQTKWGNGVHLLAPFSWKLWNAGLYWPEDAVTVILTLFGVLWLAWAWWRSPGERLDVERRPWRVVATVVALAAYLGLPILALDSVEASNSHFAQTLRDLPGRAGKLVEFDRVFFERTRDGATLHSWSQELLRVEKGGPPESGVVSVKGRFVDSETLSVDGFHLHTGRTRDLGSYAGLLILAGVWGGSRLGRRSAGSEKPDPAG